jgi:hypothetical protein
MLFWMAIPVLAAEPTVVLSLKSLDELLDDADFLGEAVGQPGLKAQAETTIDALTGGADGIDRERPLGFYWKMIDSGPNNLGNLVVFLPISDEDNFEKLVRKFLPDLQVEDDKWSITLPGMPRLHATFANEYFFVSNSPEELSDLAEVEKIASAEQDISVEINLSSIPKQAKELYLAIVEQGARQQMANDPQPANEAEARGRELGAEWTLGALKAITNEGNRLNFTVDVDSETRMATVDFGLTGTPNTSLAKALTSYGKTTSAFAAIAAEDAPLHLLISLPTTGVLDKMDDLFAAIGSSANTAIDKDETLKDDADRKAARDVANRLIAIVKATVKSGAVHSVLILEQGDGDTARIVGGTKVAKGDDAGKLWDDILKLSKESPDLAKVKSDVAKHAGARIHAITTDADEKQTALFGNDPTHLAIRADSLWLSLGGGNLEGLKKALDLSGKKAAKPQAPISLRLKPASLVTVMEKTDQELLKRAKALAGEPGDVLNLEILPTDGAGIKMQLEFGVDFFNLFGGN